MLHFILRFIDYLTSDEPLETVFRHLADGTNLRRFVPGADIAADLTPPDGIPKGKAAGTRWFTDVRSFFRRHF